MRALVVFMVLALAAAKPAPGGLYSPWGSHGLSSVSVVPQQTYAVAQPVVHAAPLAVAKPAATSYASFQQVVHPVQSVVHDAPVVAQPLVHSAPVVAQPVVHAAPVVQTVAQPVVQTYAQPLVQSYAQPLVQSYAQPVQKYVSVGSVGHGW